MNPRTLVFLGTVALIVPGLAAAQDHECACCARSGPAAKNVEPHASAIPYDVKYEGLFAGVVYSVMRHQGMDVALTIGIGEKTFDVLVAPLKWLDAKQAVFRPGDRVEIVGTRWDRGTGDTIVAREIYTVDQTIVLRDTEGRPLWVTPH
jgi:hypothetical protein